MKRLSVRWLWLRNRRRAVWLDLAALGLPFFIPPQSLVPAAVIQGNDLHGIQLLTSNLYVF